LDDPHLESRGHFVTLEHTELAGRPGLSTDVVYPGAPFIAHGSPWVMNRRPPLLGEHTDAVRAEWDAVADGIADGITARTGGNG
jgi:crotonobetainyl-CoA:carnitine CoA-transferase CaiB-like acyl-CoA transferase